VKINSIRDFVNVKQLAERVLAVEKAKEGFIDGRIISARESIVSTNDGATVPAFDLEYMVESTRGKNHFQSRATIAQRLLYVLTAQSKEDTNSSLDEGIKSILQSFRLQ
jgi:hypothetical protein